MIREAHSTRERRRLFRLVYPSGERPWVTFWGQRFPVIDVSERAVRFDLGGVVGIEPGKTLIGELRFRENDRAYLKGQVLRVSNGHAVLELTERLPQRKIFEEQRFLIRRSAASAAG